MWFTASILLILLLVLLTYFAAQPLLIALFRNNHLAVERLCLSLVYGTLIISYLFSIGSFSNIPGTYLGPAILFLVLIITALLWRQIKFHIESRRIFHFLIFLIAIASISLYPVFKHDSFVPFNDTIIYISVSDFLQNHGFFQKVNADIFHPLSTMLLMFQGIHTRMGANFFTAAIQSLIKVKHSISIFPVIQAWGMVLNLASITIAARWIFRLPWKYTLITLAFLTFCFNPLYYSVHYGFNNQLYGSAYYLLSLAAFTRLIRNSNSNNALRWVLITAIFLAGVVFVYPEHFPFIFLAFFISLFIPLMRQSKKTLRWFLLLLLLASISILISHIAFTGMLMILPQETHWVVGAHIGYSLFEFLGSAMGLMPLSPRNIIWQFTALMFCFLFLFCIWSIFRNSLMKHGTWLSAVFVFFSVFLYLLLFVMNPFIPNMKGQTWSMFKVVNYAFPTVILGIGYALSRLKINNVFIILLLAITVYTGMISHQQYLQYSDLANSFTKSDHPFKAYQEFANAVNNNPIQLPLELHVDSIKNKEVLAYYLTSKPILIDWSQDDYLSHINRVTTMIKVNQTHSMIIDKYNVITDRAKPLPANLALIDSSMPYITGYDNFYLAESFANETWHWAAKSASISFNYDKAEKIIIEFKVLGASEGTLQVKIPANSAMQIDLKKDQWKTIKYVADINKGENKISFDTNIVPVRLGSDLRTLAFSVKNLKIYPFPNSKLHSNNKNTREFKTRI